MIPMTEYEDVRTRILNQLPAEVRPKYTVKVIADPYFLRVDATFYLTNDLKPLVSTTLLEHGDKRGPVIPDHVMSYLILCVNQR